MHPLQWTSQKQHAAGFNLMEVLVAMGIFTVGFVAVAALFPAGAYMQRQATQDIESRHIEQSVRALLESIPLSYAYDEPNDELAGQLGWYFAEGLPSDNNGLWDEPARSFRPDIATLSYPTDIDTNTFFQDDEDFPSVEILSWENYDGDFDAVFLTHSAADLTYAPGNRPLRERAFVVVPFIRSITGRPQDENQWEILAVVMQRPPSDNPAGVRLRADTPVLNPDDPDWPSLPRHALMSYVGVDADEIETRILDDDENVFEFIFDDNADWENEALENIRAGDRIFDEFGRIYRVRLVNRDEATIEVRQRVGLIWDDEDEHYAPQRIYFGLRHGRSSAPIQRILRISNLNIVEP